MLATKLRRLLLALAVVLASGCATHIAKPDGPPAPSKVRLGEFAAVVLLPAGFVEPSQADSAKSAAMKIDENLAERLRGLFPSLILGGAGSPAPAGKTLSIEPVIEAIKFVSAAKRVMVGSMAGGSAVRMKVNFRDLSNGEIVAAPVFYEDVTAWTGSGSFGVADNMMLVKLAEDATNYAAQNR
jgi:hypothetical protein